MNNRPMFLTATALLLTALTAACAAQPPAPASPARPTEVAAAGHAGRSAPEPELPRDIPSLGPKTRHLIPASARQVVVTSGESADSNRSTVTLYVRDAAGGWSPASDPWPAHNALKGWTADHHAGDLHSPTGVFTLTDAGGHRANPGTRLPYDTGPAFVARGSGFHGESLAGAFDYVVAIDYNRKPGTTPLDWTRPMGASRGGGVWFHVDHGGPTHGCVSLPEARMKELLRWLDPSKRPVVVMGDAASLAR
ncbi:L,D-transpeptidase family protein [Streptomyces sp. NPDC050738]|uniref:L,D-transpeptidase family protein n=1 Tax=Streptomyces sp. NPDC050738 TaxID=3154744 RepID=UPI00343A29A2